MNVSPEQLETLRAFIEEVRASHLWSWRRDYVPQTGDEWKAALEAISKRADVATWKRVRELQSWL